MINAICTVTEIDVADRRNAATGLFGVASTDAESLEAALPPLRCEASSFRFRLPLRLHACVPAGTVDACVRPFSRGAASGAASSVGCYVGCRTGGRCVRAEPTSEGGSEA